MALRSSTCPRLARRSSSARTEGSTRRTAGRPAPPRPPSPRWCSRMPSARDGRSPSRSRIGASRSRTPPTRSAGQPGVGRPTHGRSSSPPSRVLLAVNALTPPTMRRARGSLDCFEQRQCDDGGWNFGNASVYDVDLRGYAQTTAIALIALQGAAGARSTGDRVPASSMASGAGRPHGGASLGGVPVPAGRGRDPARARRARGDGPPTGLSRAAADRRVGGAGDRAAIRCLDPLRSRL